MTENIYQVARERGWVQIDAYDWRPPEDYDGPHSDRTHPVTGAQLPLDYKIMISYIVEQDNER